MTITGREQSPPLYRPYGPKCTACGQRVEGAFCSACGAKTNIRQAAFLVHRPDRKAGTVIVDEEPWRVWTLYEEPKEVAAFAPVHAQNAMQEDRLHDWKWDWRTKTLRYFARVDVPPEGVWILVQFAS